MTKRPESGFRPGGTLSLAQSLVTICGVTYYRSHKKKKKNVFLFSDEHCKSYQ